MLVDGNAASAIADGHPAVLVDDDIHAFAGSGHRLVNAVVDDLVDEMVQTALVGTADVHAWPAANRLQALENLDVTGGVVRGQLLRHALVRCLTAYWDGPESRPNGVRDRENRARRSTNRLIR